MSGYDSEILYNRQSCKQALNAVRSSSKRGSDSDSEMSVRISAIPEY
jgi:hypothetical protein